MLDKIFNIELSSGKKAYFASDFHFGSPSYKASCDREKRVLTWLKEIEDEVGALFLLGDIFDFWFEYKNVVPKGYVRFLGKLANLCDKGIPVHFFCGNHDMWTVDYLEKEIGLKVHRQAQLFCINEKYFLMGHGDGLGPGDQRYKCLKKIFASPFLQKCFAALHPSWGFALACHSSQSSRNADMHDPNRTEKEMQKNDNLKVYIGKVQAHRSVDYFIFAHRHLPLKEQIGESLYINTGDWLQYDTYAVFDGKSLDLIYFRITQ